MNHNTLSVAVTAALALAAAAVPTPAGAVTHRHSGTEHFSIVSTTDPSTDSIIATGLFTAGGTDQAGSKVDKIKLSNGSFEIKHTGHAKSGLNAKTCLYTTEGSGTYSLADGSGAYKGIKGTGKYTETVHVVFLKTKSGACNSDANPSALHYTVSASGPASLP
jgi:hypothetical protein